MSTQAISASRALPSRRSLREIWNQPRIVNMPVQELVSSLESNGHAGSSAPRHYIGVSARLGEESVGWAAIEIEDRTGIIRLLEVDASRRRRGVGQKLLRSLLEKARYQLVTDVYVRATASDAGFFAVHGFRPIDASDLDDFDRLDGCDVDGDDSVLLHRALALPFISIPYDGITVKI